MLPRNGSVTIHAGGTRPKASASGSSELAARARAARWANCWRSVASQPSSAEQQQEVERRTEDLVLRHERPVENFVEQAEQQRGLDLVGADGVVAGVGLLQRGEKRRPDRHREQDEEQPEPEQRAEVREALAPRRRLHGHHAGAGKVDAERAACRLPSPCRCSSGRGWRRPGRGPTRPARGDRSPRERQPHEAVKRPGGVAEAEERRVVDAVEEEADERRGEGDEQSQERKVPGTKGAKDWQCRSGSVRKAVLWSVGPLRSVRTVRPRPAAKSHFARRYLMSQAHAAPFGRR
jgi:hypothetical protein